MASADAALTPSRTDAFKAELKALLEKYDVMHDVTGAGERVVFYTDFGRGQGVVLATDADAEFLEMSADKLL